MRYVLACNCGSKDFDYDSGDSVFVCRECGCEIYEGVAGCELLGED